MKAFRGRVACGPLAITRRAGAVFYAELAKMRSGEQGEAAAGRCSRYAHLEVGEGMGSRQRPTRELRRTSTNREVRVGGPAVPTRSTHAHAEVIAS
jgi:hypothetical protein